MKKNISEILEYLGEDLHRAGLEKTPEQAAKTLKFLTQGYSQNLADITKDSTAPSNATNIIEEKDIGVYSLCEEHMLPFIGKCHIQYRPNKQLILPEKLQSIVDFHARRLQNQQNLTDEIAQSVYKISDAAWVEVNIQAKHLCLMMDGMEKSNPDKVTTAEIGLRETGKVEG